MLARNSARFLNAELAQLLLDRSHAVRYVNRSEMLRHARLVVSIAEHLKSKDLSEEQSLWDLRATCHAQLSHGLRVSGDLATAEEALASGRGGLSLARHASPCTRRSRSPW